MSLAQSVKHAVLRLVHVPADPHVPQGSESSVCVFHAGKNYFKLRLLLWALGNVGFSLGLLILFGATLAPNVAPLVRTILQTLWLAAAVLFLLSLPVTYFIQRLNYEMRWYVVTDRSLRIRSGVIWLKEITMTFANIQGIRVKANPLERFLGLANVEVESAGGGSLGPHGTSSGHLARFEALDNAEEIRDLLVDRLRAYRDSGLGEKTVEAVAEATEPPALLAARQVLLEARALRHALTAPPSQAS